MSSGEEVITDFAEYTTAHGFLNIKRSDNWCLKGMWIVALIIAWLVCGLQLTMNIIAYLGYPTSTTVSLAHSSDVQFPAVSICNLNSIRYQQMTDDTEHDYTAQAALLKQAMPVAGAWNDYSIPGNDFPMSDTDFPMSGSVFPMSGTDFPMSGNFSSTNTSGEHSYEFGYGGYGYGGSSGLPVIKYNSTEILTECSYKLNNMRDIYNLDMNVSVLGHQLEDMLLDCSFQGRQCLPSNFTKWQHGSFGNCYTIVIEKDNYPSFVGPDYGLALTLFTEEDQYLPMVTPAAGFRVELHSPVYMPFPEDLGFTISPGFLTSAAVQQRVITRQPFPYDGIDCGRSLKFQNELTTANVYESWSAGITGTGMDVTMNYTNQACMKSCYQLKLVELCGCVDPAYVTRQQMSQAYGDVNLPPACNQSVYAVAYCVLNSTKVIDAACNAVCYQPCMEVDFDARITTSLWPREAYFETIKSSWAQRNPLIGSMTAEDARNKIAKLEVYFRVLNYEAITESVAIKMFDLLTNVGGTLGLYGGLSFLTILEFIECCARFVSSKKRRHHEQNSRVSTASVFADAPSTLRYPAKTFQ